VTSRYRRAGDGIPQELAVVPALFSISGHLERWLHSRHSHFVNAFKLLCSSMPCRWQRAEQAARVADELEGR